MHCECDLCIYNQNNFCILDEITVSVSGACDNCVFVSLPEAYLEKQKNIQLDRLDY